MTWSKTFPDGIKRDIRAKKFYQKQPRGLNVTSAKATALLDISKECGKGKFYSKGYVNYDYIIIQFKNYKEQIIPL
jgi:hypothetical protein